VALRVSSTDVAVRRVRRERWINHAALVATWALGVGSIAAFANGGTLCLVPLCVLLVTSVLLGRTQGAAIAGVRTTGRPGEVVIGEDGVTVTSGSHVQRFALASIASGWTERFMAVADDVVLQTTSGDVVRIRVTSRDEARAVLQAAGVAPEQRAVTLRLGVSEPSGGRVMAVFLALIVGIFGAGAILGGLAFLLSSFHGDPLELIMPLVVPPVMILAAYRILLLPLVTATLRIGTDGIQVERLWRRRFLRRVEFRSAVADGKSLVIEGASMTTRLRVSGSAEAAAVAERIRDAMREQREAAAEAVLRRLDRGGREVSAWLGELREAASGGAGYRIAAIDKDELGAVLEDGRASPEHRIAAAAALASDEAGKQRVRVAAGACADERLREAIVEAASEEADPARIRAVLG
jgi:hypothetical protein